MDKDLNNFLTPFFNSKSDRVEFIKRCLIKSKTRKMLLRVQWYTKIADGLGVVRSNRPTLQIIFLMSLAEGVARLRTDNDGNYDKGSRKMVQEFFSCTTKNDRGLFALKFKRAFVKSKYHSLRFSSVVKILYDIRNKAVHGYDFYSFSLLDKDKKKEFAKGGYIDYGVMTDGFLGEVGRTKHGNKRRKRRVPLDISLTYEELRSVIVRTAVENIKKELRS